MKTILKNITYTIDIQNEQNHLYGEQHITMQMKIEF